MFNNRVDSNGFIMVQTFPCLAKSVINGVKQKEDDHKRVLDFFFAKLDIIFTVYTI